MKKYKYPESNKIFILDHFGKNGNAYESGTTYFTGEINGEEFKIRMNKNHARNSGRNDDFSIHNLSLINVDCPSGIGSKTRNEKYQMQVDNVNDWSDVEMHVEEFFYQIENI